MKDLKGKRNPGFDVVKLIAIFLVLWGHCVQSMLSSDPYKDMVYIYIYSFHMPLFMILSGYFSFNSLNSKIMLKGIINRFKQLIIPTLFWGGYLLYFPTNSWKNKP